ncbi:hypothetical protein [Streptomyces sp. AM 2-1-1]|uniref:hypothetical protein n=1 Tax=Streptomyces sp. AM 2-1-1 TaxID=3028709 RepID=UPI0023B9025A|nr:hypothetical protein [Streptomyces sp. AM 2-1-1]WEH44001.1 hypothetical protein PZB77_31060 [Streptomyces sp. AM 2-1-1]
MIKNPLLRWFAPMAAIFTAAVLLAPQAAAADTVVARSQHSTLTMSTTSAQPGDTVTFTTSITNNTDTSQPAAMYIVADASLFDVPGSCTPVTGPTPTCEFGDDGNILVALYRIPERQIPAGATAEARLTVTVRQDAPPGTHTLRLDGAVGRDNSVFTPASVPFQVTSEADIAVGLTATAPPLLGGAITYRQTATNNGPATTAGGTVTTSLPAQTSSVTGLPANCTYNPAGKTVACTFTDLANAATATNTFTARLNLLSLGSLPANATRTTSSPTDPNPANDTATANCTVLTGLIINC